MRLVYKPEDLSPQGRSRVYFCGHPDDYERFLDSVTEDLRKHQNCVIWYDEDPRAEPETPEEERQYWEDLERMNLFVIPVTTKFLTKPNRALEKAFPFAMGHHIPVLPIVMESGISDLFKDKCGDLQMLHRFSEDLTEIPYEEKLKKYLESVLVGDELAEKVRAAFDAYIFLSYRKKDRSAAQQLMRLIHANPFCRDIAIWYDEFLVPGESFHQAIEDALLKSELFTMVVTPNVVKEKNFVTTTEYPMARDKEKKILPVEMEKTDQDELKSQCPSIPDCVSGDDEPVLSDELKRMLRDIAVRENDGIPEHNYFIGLAYLEGIDVEVDRERAVELITGAAEADLPEAMEKLVSMYEEGQGVARDYIKGAEWREELCAYWERQYEKSQTENAARELLSALSYCESAWLAAGKLERAKSVSEKLAAFAEVTDNQLYLSDSHIRLGFIAFYRGRLTEAEIWYRKALVIDEELVRETKTVVGRRSLSVSYEGLGDVAREQGKLSEAEVWYRKGLEICEELAEELGRLSTAIIGRDLSVSYERLGGIARGQGKLSETEGWHHKCLAIRKKLSEEAKETETVQARRDLSLSHVRLGDIAHEQGKLSEAEVWYRKGLEICEELAEETETVDSRRGLSISYNRLGDIARDRGRPAEAEVWYRKGLRICEELAEDTETAGARLFLSSVYISLGNITLAQVKPAEAKPWYRKVIRLFARSTDIPEKLQEAEAWYRKAREVAEELAKETKAEQARRILTDSYTGLGVAAFARGNPEEAEVWHRKSLIIRKELAEETETVEAWADLAKSYYMIGCLNPDHPDIGCLRKASEIFGFLSERSPGTARYKKYKQVVNELL